MNAKTTQPSSNEEPFDLSGEHWVVGEPSPRPETNALANLSLLEFRVQRLVIVRESNEFNVVLMRAMVLQTLCYLDDSPAVRRAKDLELDPLTAPAGELRELQRVSLRFGRAKAVLFEIDGIYFLYSMASAAKSNQQGENDFTLLICEVINKLRPVEICVASLSRLVRSYEHAPTLLTAVSKNVDRVRPGSAVLAMRGQDKDLGQATWGMLAMMAASERNSIVQRLTAGLVAKYNRGEWVKGEGAVPLGYVLDPKSRTLVVDPDPASIGALRSAWTWMADPQMSSWRILQALGDLGVTSPTAQRRYGPGATVADLHDPETYLGQLRRWAHLYLTGQHTTRWANPFEGVPHIAGMPVHEARTAGRPFGELWFEYDFGRPDIDRALIQAGLSARKARAAKPVTGGAARSRVAPLNGLTWIQNGFEFWMASATASEYHLRVRGANPGSAA